MRNLERLSNVAVICAAMLFSIVLIKNHLLNKPDLLSQNSTRHESPLKGKTISIPGIKLDQARATLVLFLSTTCHFCDESVPFYRKLAAARQSTKDSFRILTIFPQPKPVAEAYLRQHDVKTDAALSFKLEEFGVSGTPTILMVDERGIVLDGWIGKLSEVAEKEVFLKLSGGRS